MTKYDRRVAAADWAAVTAELDDYGCAPLPRLLTPAECAKIVALWQSPERFRAEVNLRRHRFGDNGDYRYFAAPFPDAVQELRQALYPRLLPIAQDWYARLGREAEWPDTLDEWLRVCHDAGQTRPTPILLRYELGGWNALHRDLYGDKVFPLQVVINLNARARITPAASSWWSSSGRGLSRAARRRSFPRGTAWCSPLVTARCGVRAVGPPRQCGTGCRRSAQAFGTPSASCSTTPPERARTSMAARMFT